MTTPGIECIGDRLRRARMCVPGLSAAALSELAELTGSHVGLIERGNVKTPSGAVVAKLAAILGVSMEWLLLGTGTPLDAEAVIAAVAEARSKVENSTAAPGR